MFANDWHARQLVHGLLAPNRRKHGFWTKITDFSCFWTIIEHESIVEVLQRSPELACVSPVVLLTLPLLVGSNSQ